MPSITTYSGHSFDPLFPERDKIDIRDIAHALSLLCRANGHFPTFYSIAQHSLHCLAEAVARGYSDRVCLACLLHDASEAYISDITRPVKQALGEYRGIEKKLQDAIYGKWLSPMPDDGELLLVREVDDALLYHEFFAQMGQRLFEKEPYLHSSPDFVFVPFAQIESVFLREFDRLMTMLL